MKRIALLLVAALTFGCSSNNNNDLDDFLDARITPVPGTIEWRAHLTSVDSSFALNGDATVVEVVNEASFTATITIRNDVVGSVRPWQVRNGTCATGGTIVGEQAAYPDLRVGADGAATVNVMIRVGLDPALPFHIKVERSDADINTVIACGDMILQK